MQDHVERRLGNYQLTRLLAQGGFAQVFLARHIYLENQVAIKVLQSQLAGNDRENFLLEARTVANLVHPNIVRVLDFGVEGSTPFLVMEYAPDGSFRQCYPKGTRLPPATVAIYIRQAASALHYAHAKRLIHRDIKPENLLLGRNGELLIGDFGVAVFAHGTLSESTQQILGTVAYMAPEQLQGRPRPASDQYALATIAYEWLCGERPFQGNLAEIATQQLLSDPPPLREKAPDVHPAVEQVIMTALAKNPGQRYPTILDFADALEAANQSIPQSEQALPALTGPGDSRPMVARSDDITYAATNASETKEVLLTRKSPAWETTKKIPGIVGMSRQQALSLLWGLLLYILSSNLALLIHLPSAHGSEFLWILPTLVIPIVFGVLYGFWVGLVVGGLGYLLGSFVSIIIRLSIVSGGSIGLLTLSSLNLPWYFLAGFLAVGSIAGLATIFTQGKYRSIQNIVLAETFSAVGILGGFLMIFNGLWRPLYKDETLWKDFTHIALPNMGVAIVLLIVILMIRNFFIASTHRSKHRDQGTFSL